MNEHEVPVELYFHDNGYDRFGDYRVGHPKPRIDVALGNGNPQTLLLKEWLRVLATWSAGNPVRSGLGPM